MHVAMLAAFLLAVPGHVAPFQRGSESKSPPPPSFRFQQPKSKALIFASKDYQKQDNLPNTFVDAGHIESILRKSYGFDVEIYRNPTRNDVLKVIDSLAWNGRDEFDHTAQLLVYFSGHGKYVANPDKAGYLTFVESPDGNNDLEYFHLERNLFATRFNRILVVLDVCEAGLFASILDRNPRRGDDVMGSEPENEDSFLFESFAEAQSDEGRYVIVPSRGAISDGEPGRGSPFANAFVSTLADVAQGDGAIKASVLVSKLKQPGTRHKPFVSGANSEPFHFVSVRRAREWNGKRFKVGAR